ncbi:hypothetical protein [Marivita geojedonensis]|uniref:Uncharacterized protein n=1 Tax=Marivita geojedonensis TaxID=1123756 RepID=A0A1X4N9A5_9RHOB|nr:hypothetical protein [Marivita geojedonensis]OSQ42899.1 hypothetical protein MGEO_20215 [Marivita geojedonensis]PRY71843.1 hypothetical protein CLV76_1396 [Marivita geojedonensis]
MIRTVLSCLAALAAAPAFASDAVLGEATTFSSPNGVVERCVRITPIPGGAYSNGDLKDEAAYCAIDLYAAEVALCPKTWSTSPGMMVYEISTGPYANDRAAFERNACKEGKSAKDLAEDDLAKFKVTMNAEGTSGTYSASPLLYYHFSRYFDMAVMVPVTVWRSMDVAMHNSEVARPGLANSGHNRSARMNHAGWQHLVDAEANPASYSPTNDIFTSDRTQIYGILTSSPGHRYGSEMNGTRKSGWGKGQSLDFQETPAFLALREDAPLIEAIDAGLSKGRRDSQINRDLGPDVPREQMAYWMREISEIVLLDFIFSQQDRVGNIDFTPYYYWAENGEVKHKKAKHHEVGDGDVPEGALLLRRTNLNDNDAGGRVAYANFAKSTQMLEKLRHFDGKMYTRLVELDRDLQKQGPIYQWLAQSLGLKDREVAQVVNNTALAVGILQDSCRAGRLRFDLNPKTFFLEGDVVRDTVACDLG